MSAFYQRDIHDEQVLRVYAILSQVKAVTVCSTIP